MSLQDDPTNNNDAGGTRDHLKRSRYQHQNVPAVIEMMRRVSDEFAERDAPALRDHIIQRVTLAYVKTIDPDDPPEPWLIRQQLVAAVNQIIEQENRKFPKDDKGSRHNKIKELEPVQVAQIVHRLHHIAEVTPGGADSDDGLGVLAIYQEDDEFAGLYRRADLGLLSRLARQFNYGNTDRWFTEFERSVREFAPKVTEDQDPDLVVMGNLIYDYRTDERISFSPDHVYLARNSETDLIEEQHPVPEVHDDDGNVIWNYEAWWRETVPDEGTREYCQSVIGAALRPSVDWQVMPAMHSESGSNGKGSILEHVRALVGQRHCVSVPLKAYSSQFGKEQLIGKRLNLPDETPVGEFIKDASDLKSIITNDPITIDRKHKTPISYKPRIFTVLTLNGALNFQDKSESMDRRLAIIPMTQRFTGAAKDPAIKTDYLLRREVCEYIAYKVLVEMPKYWQLDEPPSVQRALHRHKVETNTVLAFFEEYKDEFQRPFLPFAMLHALYKADLRDRSVRANPVDQNTFTKEIKTLFDPAEWVVPSTPSGADRKLSAYVWLSADEPVLDPFEFDPGVWKWQYESNAFWHKKVARQLRGLVRRDVYDAWIADGSRPDPAAVNRVALSVEGLKKGDAA
ncbi:MAG: phage/plasmid primase, P4 family [Propionibacteriaceae bacterium]